VLRELNRTNEQHQQEVGNLKRIYYRRNALADNVTAQVIRDEKRNLFLHINETPIAQWFKEQFGLGHSETQSKGIRL
jgi:hypothetical protein